MSRASKTEDGQEKQEKVFSPRVFWAYSLGSEGEILTPWSVVSLKIAVTGE